MIMDEELSCKGCKHLDFPYKMYCDLEFDLGKDEFAQTVPMYSVITGKKCRYKII